MALLAVFKCRRCGVAVKWDASGPDDWPNTESGVVKEFSKSSHTHQCKVKGKVSYIGLLDFIGIDEIVK